MLESNGKTKSFGKVLSICTEQRHELILLMEASFGIVAKVYKGSVLKFRKIYFPSKEWKLKFPL